ncbi:hypothetical protein [Nonomuraea dietziae]|uniref:hypothetical protein n=1 Tax=Nonomuraea dietziae TaxID=65515 RepID=UPI0031DA37B1
MSRRRISAEQAVGRRHAFLQEAPHNTIAMLLVWTWQQLGVNTLLFAVGLQSIPKEPIEAARLDGGVGMAALPATSSGR